MKDKRLLEANELFYYAWKFRDAKFLICLTEKNSITQIVGDLRVLQSSGIKFSIVCQDSAEARNTAKNLKERGFIIDYHTEPNKKELENTELKTPAIYAINQQDLIEYTFKIANKLGVERIFYLSDYSGIFENQELKSYLSFSEVKKLISSQKEIGFPKEILESFLSKQNIEISLLKSEKGSLFQEIFSHEGHGTLITDSYSINIRKAENKDIIAIHSMLKPSINAGWVLDISEDKIADLISQFFVYTINSKVVAAAMIQDFENGVELAKFCTIPRFQGRGGARKLAKRLIKEAKDNNKTFVFSLSTNEAMWNLFTSLGMSEINRESLPKKWLENYDLSRPSKAFKLEL